jgi:hypothetical protein
MRAAGADGRACGVGASTSGADMAIGGSASGGGAALARPSAGLLQAASATSAAVRVASETLRRNSGTGAEAGRIGWKTHRALHSKTRRRLRAERAPS